MQEYVYGGWHWLKPNQPIKEHLIEGKYLFYCAEFAPLVDVAKMEIDQYHFPLAKIILPEYKVLDDFVLCLYDYQENNEKEMIQRFEAYTHSHGVRFWRWKSDEETRRGEYEPAFVEKMKEMRR